MFYSQNEFDNAVASNDAINFFAPGIIEAVKSNGTFDKKKSKQVFGRIKNGIRSYEEQVDLSEFLSPTWLHSHNHYDRFYHLGKIARPWDVVPRLRDFLAPEGDYSVGLEVEYGFDTADSARETISFVANWKNVCLDREGGTYGVETTFPPMLFSKITNNKPVFRYLRHLKEKEDRLAHHLGRVGTHVNVGSWQGGFRTELLGALSDALSRRTSDDDKRKYFGRMPYGYLYQRGNYVEYKLFNSTTDVAAVRRYINVAVSLTKLLDQYRNAEIRYGVDPVYSGRSDNGASTFSREDVFAALERGYNGTV